MIEIDDAKKLVAEALGMAFEDVSEDTSISTTPNWDSLAHLRLVLAIEKHLDRNLSPPEIVTITDLSSVRDL